VGQLGKLRVDWQSTRAAIPNRRAGYHPAPRNRSSSRGHGTSA
jgi:hypothetical protein